MNLATARTILENPERAPTRADFVRAGEVLADHWKRHPEQLRPARRGGVMTFDAPATVTRQTITRDLNATRAMMDNLLRLVAGKRGLTRDADLGGERAQSTRSGGGVVSEPTVG
jgi:hypothetical protein